MTGHAHAAQFRSICQPEDHVSKAMTRLRDDESLKDVRDKFYEGELTAKPTQAPPCGKPLDANTPEEMLLRIESRLRRIVVKACENSAPASTVVNTVEAFLVRAHRGKKVMDNDTDWWVDLLLEPPTVTCRIRDDVYSTRFLFDGDSPNGGFHRLLLHGLCQFHGLKAASSTVQVIINETKGPVQARLLVATGTIVPTAKKIKLVDTIMQRKQLKESNGNEVHTEPLVQKVTNAIQTLKV